MAIPVARVHLAAAHAALPGLLPTPPNSNMLPRLATRCVLILPMSPPKPGSRADAADVVRKSPSLSKPGRADAAERWDARKIKPSSPASPSSSQRSSSDSNSGSGRSCSHERWDAKKKSSSGSNNSLTSRAAAASSAAARWDSTKLAINCSSSAERLDAHKKPCPKQSAGKSNHTVLGVPQRAFYSGPGFAASPAPSMLPLPSFMVHVA
ncbi:hypothetical protein BS78_02G054400 [Paspalum vaginatum]|nr:hypothetical protein BS78_02G054400 [Paspalum vaginatum]